MTTVLRSTVAFLKNLLTESLPRLEVVHLIALIALLAVAILLLILAIRYRVSGEMYFRKGVRLMADKKVDRKEKSNVISEIDREISDIIDEEVGVASAPSVEEESTGKIPKTPETSSSLKTEVASETKARAAPSEPEKIPEHTEAKPQEEQGLPEESELERDGIIIRKG